MKTFGIIGGLGAETTADFYLEVVKKCSLKLPYRPRLIFASVPLDINAEKQEILSGVISNQKELLINEAQSLELAGADYICMPCNSMHIFEKDIKNSVKTPFVSIVDATVNFIRNVNLGKGVILSALLTAKFNIYKQVYDFCDCYMITWEEQERLNQIVLNLTIMQSSASDKEFMKNLIEKYAKMGAEFVVLACTDLYQLAPKNASIPIYDTMTILTDSVVDILCAE